MATIFLDVDGTLLDSKSHLIPESTIKALKLAQTNNHKLVIATGRHLTKLLEIKQIRQIKWDAYILDNGSLILDNNYQVLNKLTLDNKTVEQLIAECEKLKIKISLQLSDSIILPLGIDRYVKNTYDFLGWELKDQIRSYQGEEVIYALIYQDREKDFSHFEKFDLAVYPNNSDYADLNHPMASKAHGLNFINSKFKMESYCFGDGANDISMFEVADTAVAMANACDELKEKADYLTSGVDNDGIYNAFKHFDLI